MKHKLVAGAISLALMLAWATPVFANSNCNPGRTNDYLTYRWDAWDLTGINFSGVWGTIEDQSPYLHQTPGSQGNSSTWIMLANSTEYIQIGWLDYHGAIYDVRQGFTEWDLNDGTGAHRDYFSDISDDSTSAMGVSYAAGNNRFDLTQAGSFWRSVTPAFVPASIQVSTETHSAADQFPGGYNDHVSFTSLRGRTLSGANMFDFNPSGMPYGIQQFTVNTAPYGVLSRQGNSVSMWDTYCP